MSVCVHYWCAHTHKFILFSAIFAFWANRFPVSVESRTNQSLIRGGIAFCKLLIGLWNYLANMVFTRDADDVWREVRDKSEEYLRNKQPIFTLVRGVRNHIVKVEADRILRQSDEPVSAEGGPSEVRRAEVEAIWNAIRENGQAVQEEIHALRFAWALVGTFISGLKFYRDPFRLVVVNEELANQSYRNEEAERKTVSIRRGRTGNPYGGELEEHRKLKNMIAEDPMKHLGEQLNLVAEGIEFTFETADRLDLLFKDTNGRFVCVEVKVSIGPQDNSGFLQAGKYRTLVAMSEGLEIDDVRTMVVARSMDQTVIERFSAKYNIEWKTIESTPA